jgi:hypothetical protein
MALSKIDNSMLTSVTTPNVKSIWINGDMAVSQRTTSASGKTAGGYHAVDTMQLDISGTCGTWTVAQESLTSGSAYTAGFANAYRIDCTSATASPADAAFLKVISSFEGRNLQMFKKGTASAEKWTLAFWVKSNRTGTAQVNLRDMDNTRMIGASYSISSADTWEFKVCNFAADTTGALDDDKNRSLIVEWWLDGGGNNTSGAMPTAWETRAVADSMAAGSLDLAGSTDNDWAITGVQLEVGEFNSDTLPSFKHESFADNLYRCQRYYYKLAAASGGYFGSGNIDGSNDAQILVVFPCVMRISPTAIETNGTASHYAIRLTSNTTCDAVPVFSNTDLDKAMVIFKKSSHGLTNGAAAFGRSENATAYLAWSAEL